MGMPVVSLRCLHLICLPKELNSVNFQFLHERKIFNDFVFKNSTLGLECRSRAGPMFLF